MQLDDEIQRYRDDPEWDDVDPLPLTDDEQAAVRIATSDAFNDAFMYLRAVVQSNEMSERAFMLTSRCIELNAANYTVWQYRRVLLKALKKDLYEELAFLDEEIENNPKNYQVWRHRQVLVEWLDDPKQELSFTSRMIESESKNYHAWQHRQWVIRRFKLYDQLELDFSAALLLEDVRNNSAWNYRYFILQGMEALNDEGVLNREIAMTEAFIKKAPNNESAWNYLAGLLIDKGLSSRGDVMLFCEELTKEKKVPQCLSFMVDTLIELMEKENSAKNGERAIKLLEELKKIDPIRVNYWDYQQRFVRGLMCNIE
ncbi:hypothetical protein AB6A40_003850 [Gnathostoma spinigerum]|uniref:Protein farnesyltransferase/geranylgeranyltransferase type-1 subunit alpha n=1 Tax=Gnathostoma spinigerum TaxID=75299 RepID=A0ABD6EID3_9BILA